MRQQGFADQKVRILTQVEEIKAGRRAWARQWETAMQALKLPTGTLPDDAMAHMDALEEVFRKLDDAQATRQRVDAMARNQTEFQQRVQEAVTGFAPQLAGLAPETAAAGLKDLLSENLERRRERQLLEEERRKKRQQLSNAKEKLAGSREVLRQLCAQAATADPEQLPEVEKRAGRKNTVLKEAAAVKERLSELAAGQPLDAFIETVRQQDPDLLAAELETAETEKSDLIQEREQLVAAIAVGQNELDQFDGRSRATGLAVEADGLAARIGEDVALYMKLRLAGAMLAKAIERFRKHNQSPVLDAAGVYFRTITAGAFAGLKADFDDKGDPVLKAVRRDGGTALSIEALSDGTRDQMFLALRMGALQRHIETSDRLPFIVDDVLVHFDDDRAFAALQAMAGLAARTQIIFFTHHGHLVDLAREAVPEDLLDVHEL